MKNKDFLPPDTHRCVCISEDKKCSFFGKFSVLRFLVTSALRIALLPYCRGNNAKEIQNSLNPFQVNVPLLYPPLPPPKKKSWGFLTFSGGIKMAWNRFKDSNYIILLYYPISLYYIILYYHILHYITLYYIILHYFSSQDSLILPAKMKQNGSFKLKGELYF